MIGSLYIYWIVAGVFNMFPQTIHIFLQIGDYTSDFMMAAKLAFVTTKRIKKVRTAL